LRRNGGLVVPRCSHSSARTASAAGQDAASARRRKYTSAEGIGSGNGGRSQRRLAGCTKPLCRNHPRVKGVDHLFTISHSQPGPLASIRRVKLRSHLASLPLLRVNRFEGPSRHYECLALAAMAQSGSDCGPQVIDYPKFLVFVNLGRDGRCNPHLRRRARENTG
jgi:hypothetical protein